MYVYIHPSGTVVTHVYVLVLNNESSVTFPTASNNGLHFILTTSVYHFHTTVIT